MKPHLNIQKFYLLIPNMYNCQMIEMINQSAALFVRERELCSVNKNLLLKYNSNHYLPK